jgi:hypothetical protein
VAALEIASKVVEVFGFLGTSTRDRIFAIAESAGVVPVLLVVVAILILRTRHASARWPVAVGRGVAVVVVVASIYGLWYVIFVHTDFPSADISQSYVAFVTRNSALRFSGVIRFASAGVLAVGALRFASWPAAESDSPTP